MKNALEEKSRKSREKKNRKNVSKVDFFLPFYHTLRENGLFTPFESISSVVKLPQKNTTKMPHSPKKYHSGRSDNALVEASGLTKAAEYGML